MENDCTYTLNVTQNKHQHRRSTGDLGSTRHFGRLKCFHLVVGGPGSPLTTCESGFPKQTQLFDAVLMVMEKTASGSTPCSLS